MRWIVTFCLMLVCVSRIEAQINYYNLPAYEIPKYGWTNNLGVVGGYQQYDASYTNIINVLTNIPGTNMLAYGDGTNDDTLAIQTAIDLAPNGSVIYLPKPTAYYLNTNAWIISGNKHIIMRGDYNQSWIYRPVPVELPIIWIRQNSLFNTYSNTSILTNGSESVTVDSADCSMTNNYFFVGSTVAPPDVISNGASDNSPYDWNFVTNDTFPNGSIPTEVVQVTNVVGNTVYFTPPYRFDLTNGGVQGLVEVCDWANSANRCGIENLNFTITTNLELAGASPGWATITIDSVQDCWITGCILATNAPEAIQWDYASHSTAESNIVHHAYDYIGSWGYGYYGSLCDNDILVENCIGYNLRHAFVVQGYQTAWVWGYDYETNECYRYAAGTPDSDVSGSFLTHGLGIKYVLTEGCVGDFYSYDNVHGNATDCTMLRDASFPVTYNDDWPDGLTGANGEICVQDAANNNWMSVVGCVFGISNITSCYLSVPTNQCGSGYSQQVYAIGFWDSNNSTNNYANTITNLFCDFNYDVVSGETLSDAEVSDNNISASYYLTGRPGWWNFRPFPSIGPDLGSTQNAMITPNPAMDRFYNEAAPIINSLIITNQLLVITVANATALSVLQVSTDFTNWQVAGLMVSINAGSAVFIAPMTGPSAFFRVIQ